MTLKLANIFRLRLLVKSSLGKRADGTLLFGQGWSQVGGRLLLEWDSDQDLS